MMINLYPPAITLCLADNFTLSISRSIVGIFHKKVDWNLNFLTDDDGEGFGELATEAATAPPAEIALEALATPAEPTETAAATSLGIVTEDPVA